jgi:hypothetical protein
MHLPIRSRTTTLDAKRGRTRSRGQVLVMFAGGMIFFIGLMAIVIDVSWYWANTLRVQRAADAAALAGAVYLPGNVPNGKTYAIAEAKKNGYTDGQAVPGGTISVVPTQDANDVRQLDVTVSAPVGTFFMRVFGINTITASRTAKAIYVQPVPMGSPENYYGIYCLTTTSDSNCDASTQVPDASGSGLLASKGFWGAFQSSGDVHNEGDAFTPYNDTLNPGSNSAGGTNPDFSPKGYDYAVEVPAAGGNIYIYDPDFCVVGGGLGSGDHYNADNNRQFGGPAGKYWSVYSKYDLFDTQGTLFTTGDDTLVTSSGNLFAHDFASDQTASKPFGDYTTFNVKPGDTSLDGYTLQNCSNSNAALTPAMGAYWHDKWWPIGTNLPAGTYRINVQSAAVGSSNWKAQAENDFGVEVTGAAGSRVYGLGKMAAYNILPNGAQDFYLAQIDQTAAGKTIEIDLFDPGDVSGNATLSVLNPDGNVYTSAAFSYTTFNLTGGGNNCIGGNSDSCSAPMGRTSIKTAVGGSSSFNNTWIRILIPLPSTYGSTGLTPPGEPQPGWWKIHYVVTGGNDTTTWMVNIRGNPVHLIVP